MYKRQVQGLNLEKGSSISIIGRGSSSAYWKAVQEGAKQAVADINTNLGYKGNDKVKLVYSCLLYTSTSLFR